MNVCVGDIIKLENNQFVAVRGRCPSRPTGLSPPPFFLGGGRKECVFPVDSCLLNTHGRKLS